MKKSRKVLKITLFITFFCLVTLFLSQQKVSAKTVNVTTIQELQEVMGATEYSTIDGTILKITSNFTWTIPNDIDIKIPELTIDFNGKEIRIGTTAWGDHIKIGGKVIFKDSQGGKGGIYWKADGGISVLAGSELIIENGQYTTNKIDRNVGVRS